MVLLCDANCDYNSIDAQEQATCRVRSRSDPAPSSLVVSRSTIPAPRYSYWSLPRKEKGSTATTPSSSPDEPGAGENLALGYADREHEARYYDVVQRCATAAEDGRAPASACFPMRSNEFVIDFRGHEDFGAEAADRLRQ